VKRSNQQTNLAGQLEEKSWTHWAFLVATCVGATFGLVAGLAPLVRRRLDAPWPWPHSELVLLGGLLLAVSVLTFYLTHMQRRIVRLRVELSAKNEPIEPPPAAERIALLDNASDLRSMNRRLSGLFRLLRQFTDNFAHEFRTPLTVITESVSALRDELGHDIVPEQRDYLDTVMRRVDDLRVMVDDLLDISRIEAGILCTFRKQCCMADIIADVRARLERKASQSGVTLEVEVEPDLPTLYCDPENVAHVVANLVLNAFKFCDDGGHVVLRCRIHPDGRQVTVSVADDGPGIAPEHMIAIFEPFQQFGPNLGTSTQGFGLGLHVVRELVHLNLGEVRVQSEAGRGSVFSFTLPSTDPSTLLGNYIRRLQGFRSSTDSVSLLSIAIDAVVTPGVTNEVEQFLQRQIRRTDLLLRTRPETWFLVAATGEEGSHLMLKRLRTAYREAHAVRSVLPEIRWRIDGTWRIDERTAQEIGHRVAMAAPDALSEASKRPASHSRAP
jgi:signal transduction histidine kinase